MGIVTYNNQILTVGTDGIATDTACCCESSCPDGDPEIYVKIFDADYAGGSINWCGFTWTQAEIQAGAEKGPVCPTVYEKSRTYVSSKDYNAGENWTYINNGTVTSLRLVRRASAFLETFGPIYTFENFAQILNYFTDHVIWYSKAGSPNTLQSDLNLILTVPRPTNNNYYITDAFFGSYTTSGVQYSWRRGNGW